MPGPLKGLRIVEFAGIGPGPFCGMMLADHGAEIIRLDRLTKSSSARDATREFTNRSRTTISVDLKDERGVALVRKLCGSADGCFEGFRPGVMERLGLGPDVLIGENPKLVYGRMTGWGQDGPYADMAGHDINYIALSGALHAVGRKGERPTPPLNLVGDFGGGGMMLAFGMVAALLNAHKTGKGQVVDCAMTEGSAVLMAMIHSLRAQGLWRDERGANLVDGAAHFYDTYETKDGKYISVGAIEPQFYRTFLELTGLSDDPAFAAQHDVAQWAALKDKVAARIKAKTRAEWAAIFDGQDACAAPVMSLDEAPDHPHNIARRAWVEVGGVRQPAPAPRYSVSVTDTPAPMQSGQAASDAVLTCAGLAESDIQGLREQGVIG